MGQFCHSSFLPLEYSGAPSFANWPAARLCHQPPLIPPQLWPSPLSSWTESISELGIISGPSPLLRTSLTPCLAKPLQAAGTGRSWCPKLLLSSYHLPSQRWSSLSPRQLLQCRAARFLERSARAVARPVANPCPLLWIRVGGSLSLWLWAAKVHSMAIPPSRHRSDSSQAGTAMSRILGRLCFTICVSPLKHNDLKWLSSLISWKEKMDSGQYNRAHAFLKFASSCLFLAGKISYILGCFLTNQLRVKKVEKMSFLLSWNRHIGH